MRRSTEPVPARHQRRVAIWSGPVAVTQWQAQYPGSIFVCIPGSANDAAAAYSVLEWIRRRASRHRVTFVATGSLGALRGTRVDTLALLVIGATDAVGFPAAAVAEAAATAAAVNDRLGRPELAIPRTVEVVAGQVLPGPTEDISLQDAAALLAEGERRIRTEWEQRAEYLEPTCVR